MKMQRKYLLPERREKNTLAPPTVKMMLSQIRSRVLRKSPPLFREKRQVFFIASTRIRKNIGFSQMNIKASHNDEKALTKHSACLYATPNKIHKCTHTPTGNPHRSITLPLSKKTCGNGSVRSTNRHRKNTESFQRISPSYTNKFRSNFPYFWKFERNLLQNFVKSNSEKESHKSAFRKRASMQDKEQKLLHQFARRCG